MIKIAVIRIILSQLIALTFAQEKQSLMKNISVRLTTIRMLAIIILLDFTGITYSQTADSTKQRTHFTGSAGLTNNGISVVPTFSFDKPAAIFLMSVEKRRLSFEPDIRFPLDLKRGGVALWWRYKILMKGKLRLNTGAHPAINFDKTDSIKAYANGVRKPQYFLGGEVVPYYVLSKKINIGAYYLYAHGLQKNGPRNVHFLTVNGNFSNFEITKQLTLMWSPQFYYLNIDKKDGFYFTSTLTLLKKDFPISIQSIINKAITTNIAGNNFVWNLSLFYLFKG